MNHLYQHTVEAAATSPPADPERIAALLPKPQNLDSDWILLSGFMIILMQLGFALIEAGSVRYKNSQSIVIKVILGLFCTILIWWLFGYGFSFGNDRNTGFLGGNKLANSSWEANELLNDYSNFVIRVASAAISVSVLSGAAAERMTFLAWSVLAIIYSGFIYAALVHWTFAGGWIHQMGFKDFSGSGIVFFAAGIAAIIVTIFLKPRRYRFDPNTTLVFPSHSPIFISFGSLVLFAGWLFFNSGLVAKGENEKYPQALVPVNTLIAGATGGFVSFIVRYFQDESTSLVALSRGIVIGLVTSCASANEIYPWVAFIFGAIAGVAYNVVAKAVPASHIDDPTEVIPVYVTGGFLGIFLSGLFDQQSGLFYGQGITFLGVQLLGLLIIALWVGVFTILVLVACKGFGILRISPETEIEGLDKAQCLGEAVVYYNQSKESLTSVSAREPSKIEIPSRLRNSQIVQSNLARSIYQ